MLSENLYTLRRKSGLSQEQLAEKIGVSRQAVSKWESGLSTPELEKLRALSEFFQITIDELTGDGSPSGGREEPKAPPPRKTAGSLLGAGLCLLGAVCLILSGVLTAASPATADRIDASSVVTLNGTGILAALFVLLMVLGIVLILMNTGSKKK